MSISQPPPPCPSILSELERNARQMRVVWAALVKERDDLLKERGEAHQRLTDALVVKSDGHGHEYNLTERIVMLTQQRDIAFDGKQNARRDAFQYAEALKRELDYLKNRPATVNEAGVILGQLVHAKALHERGDNEAYTKAKGGLWERAFALVGEAMPKHLDCPNCGKVHVDRDETADHPGGEDWTKRLHKTHLCHHCHTTWRPEERCYTVGVRQTKADAPPIGPVPEFILKEQQRADTFAAAAAGDALAQVLTLLKLDASAVPRTGPLPQALVNQLDDINAVLEEAATRNLNLLADKSGKVTVSGAEYAEMKRAKDILDQIRSLGT